MTSIEATPPAAEAQRRARLNTTLAYYTAFIVLGLAAAAIGPTLPGLAQQVRATIAQVSYLFVMQKLGYLIGSLLAGRVYDRVRGHPLMAGVILLMAAAMVLVPVVPLLWLLAGVLFCLGLFMALLDVGTNTLIVWVHREGIGPYMNGLHFFWGLGAFISPIIIAQAVQASGDIQWAYWSLAVLMLPPALWLARRPSPSAAAPGVQAAPRPAAALLVGLITLFNFFYVGCEVAFGGWIYTYATTLHLGSPAVAAYLTSGFWGALTAGRLISIPLAARVPASRMLLGDLLLVLAGLAVILALPGSFAALWVGTLAVGLGMASVFPTILILAGRSMTITGSVTGWFFAGSSLGGMFLPWLIGQLFEPVGPRVFPLAVGVDILINLLLFGLIMRSVRREAVR